MEWEGTPEVGSVVAESGGDLILVYVEPGSTGGYEGENIWFLCLEN